MPTHDFIDVGDVLNFDIIRGTVVTIDSATDTCTVTVGDLTLTALLCYHCKTDSVARDSGAIIGAASGFKVGDNVIIVKRKDNGVIKVIGHVDGIRRCGGDYFVHCKIETATKFRLYLIDCTETSYTIVQSCLCDSPVPASGFTTYVLSALWDPINEGFIVFCNRPPNPLQYDYDVVMLRVTVDGTITETKTLYSSIKAGWYSFMSVLKEFIGSPVVPSSWSFFTPLYINDEDFDIKYTRTDLLGDTELTTNIATEMIEYLGLTHGGMYYWDWGGNYIFGGWSEYPTHAIAVRDDSGNNKLIIGVAVQYTADYNVGGYHPYPALTVAAYAMLCYYDEDGTRTAAYSLPITASDRCSITGIMKVGDYLYYNVKYTKYYIDHTSYRHEWRKSLFSNPLDYVVIQGWDTEGYDVFDAYLSNLKVYVKENGRVYATSDITPAVDEYKYTITQINILSVGFGSITAYDKVL